MIDLIFLKATKPTVMILSFRIDRSGQTVQTQIRLLLEEQSDQELLEEQSDQGLQLFAIPLASFGCITLRSKPTAAVLCA